MVQNALTPINIIDVGRQRPISTEEATIVAGILQEFAQYQWVRNMFGGQWEEAAELIDPNSRNTFFYLNYNTPGMKKTAQQIDASGAAALSTFVAIANSMVTPRPSKWHGLEASDPYVMKDRDTRRWFEDVTNIVFQERYLGTANFFDQNKANWKSIGAYGNCTMFIDAFDGRLHGNLRGLRYRAVPLGETFFGENHQKKVDRMIRWFKLTAYQAVQKWGIDRLPENLHASLKQNSQWPYDFLHCVKPREDYDPERLDVRGMPFCSYYVSIQGQCLMQPEGGYPVFPFAIGRYEQAPNEVYGRGPAQIVLPALKTLNAEKRTFLKAGHRAADPVLLTADDGILGMDLRPGAMNKGGVTTDGRPLVHTLPIGSIQITKEMMADEKQIIEGQFLVSIFKTLVENPNMTATQVIQLVNERGMLVAPTLGGQFSYIEQMAERELSLLARMTNARGRPKLPPMPPRLREAGGEYRIIDTSPLALAAKMGEAAGFIRTVENVRELVNVTQDASLLDPFNFDVAVPAIANIQGVPESWMADADMIAQKRQARAQQAQRQEQIAAAPAQAAIIKARAVAAKSGALEAPPGGQPGAM